tara:strand:- start:1523 stop:1711 length:189 start_codon:yes stop_codon:yes gene_type:complete
MLKSLITKELQDLILKTDYYGSEEQIENENIIAKVSKIEPLDKETVEEWYFRIYYKISNEFH